MKTSELTGDNLDKLVHQTWCEGACHDEPFPSYSTDWAQGGPIIEHEGIGIGFGVGIDSNRWEAGHIYPEETGPTPLIAAMRCYVASKLGDKVDVPDELLTTGE